MLPRPPHLRRALLAAAIAGAAAGPGHPGAWPREPGSAFVSVRTDVALGGGRPAAAIYGEYGLTDRLTLGGQASDDGGRDRRRLGAFARLALTGEVRDRLAVSLGVSAPPDHGAPRLEAGLHWGRGFESRLGPGWATATARVLFAENEPRPITDLFGLVGVRPAPGRTAMLALARYRDAGGTYYKLTPSFGFEIREAAWIVPSLTREVGDHRSTRVGLALWLSF